MQVFLILAVFAAVAFAQRRPFEEEHFDPIPYQFAYTAQSDEGSHSAQETSDGNGRVEGSYTFKLADGRIRTVNYVADENGYRAAISTNEPGTESQSPADSEMQSSALPAKEASEQYTAQNPVQLRSGSSAAPTTVLRNVPLLRQRQQQPPSSSQGPATYTVNHPSARFSVVH